MFPLVLLFAVCTMRRVSSSIAVTHDASYSFFCCLVEVEEVVEVAAAVAAAVVAVAAAVHASLVTQ
jgi:hypothetical protein